MKKYIIVELIPTSRKKETGDIVQLSALKINDLDLIDRFDYRLNEKLISNPQLLKMINYDKTSFKYCNSTNEIIKEFKKWIGKTPLLIIDNEYTISYLSDISNKKESIFKHLDMEYNENIIEDIIQKYKLQPSNYIVDLLYEALIYKNNK